MQWLIVAAICIHACLANEVKNATAKGSYGPPPSSYGMPSYDQPSYDQGYGTAPSYGGGYMGYQFIRPPPLPLMDRDVCDLDASILLVVHSRRYGHHDRDRHHDHHHGGPRLNRAHRVRCSVLANYDEDSCNTCCQHAARRDKSIPNSAFVGFLAVTDDFEHKRHEGGPPPPSEEDRRDDDREHMDDEEDGPMRFKRSHDSHDYQSIRVDSIRVPMMPYKPSTYYTNVKCVCCAPKRPLPPPPPPPVYPGQQPPMYQQPAASQPSYQPPSAASQPSYQPPPPAASQPSSYPQQTPPAASEATYPAPPAASQPADYQQAPPAASQPNYPAQAPAPAPPAAAPPASSQPVYQQAAAPPAQNPTPY